MGGLLSMASSGASGVAKGNYLIFANFLKESRAKFYPETAVMWLISSTFQMNLSL